MVACFLGDAIFISPTVQALHVYCKKPSLVSLVSVPYPSLCGVFRAAEVLRLLDSDQELQQERAQLQRRAKQFKGYSREDLENNQEFMVEPAKRSCSWVRHPC